jgi:hypothetical protein
MLFVVVVVVIVVVVVERISLKTIQSGAINARRRRRLHHC